jgi:uncharacterized membrane protein YkoI
MRLLFSIPSDELGIIAVRSRKEMGCHVARFTLLWAAVLLGAASGAETKVAMKDLPAAVQKGVAEQSKGAVIHGLTKEIENGKTEYEVELIVNGHGKDISFDSAGNVVAVEEEVKLESLPPAARAAIQSAAGDGTLRKVEWITEGGKSFYEASIRKSGKSSEVQVNGDGTHVK